MSEATVEAHLTGLATALAATRALAGEVASVAERVVTTLRGGGTLYFCGNGGSAADAQHLAAEYVVRFGRERPALPAVALTVDTSIITAAGNDYGFERVFSRQIEALASPDDLLVLHSTSGQSENLIQAARTARARGVTTVAFLARDGGRLCDLVDIALVVPTEITAHAQELHLALGHAICEIVERALTEEGGATPSAVVPEGDDVALLEEARRREKDQTLYYRRLAAEAEDAGRHDESERLNALHADEQHHLSRLTARLLEAGLQPAELRRVQPPEVAGEAWEDEARGREEDEVRYYRELLGREVWTPETRAVLEEILDAERHHARELGGKWMPARPPEADPVRGER